MNTKLVSVLAAVCLVCALIIIGEWFYSVQAQKQILSSITSGETTQSDDEMPGIELTQKSEESYVDLVSRPLFIKGRKPVDEPSPEDELTNAVAKNFDWQLNGVYSTKKGLAALFSRSTSKVPKDNHRKINTGADLDGWKLTEIQKDRAIFKQGDQQKELLLRKPKLKELPNKSRVPNMPNVPQPEVSPQPEVNPQPAEGEFENNNEQL
jgi:hypothetical protein